MNELDDTIAQRLGDILRLDTALKVWNDAPESVDDVPAAIVGEISGTTSSAAYRGLKEATLTVRLILLVAQRGRAGLPKASTLTRPWIGRVLGLLWTHDELSPADEIEPIGEIQTIEWREGNINFGGVDFIGAEFTLTLRVDWQMYYGNGPVGTLPSP
jgi:hypothetical protein